MNEDSIKLTVEDILDDLEMNKRKNTDGITAELPVANGIVQANQDLSIVKFADGHNFNVDTAVSIGLKNNTRKTAEFKKIQKALDSISQEERLKIMEDAVKRAPTEK